MKSHLAIAIDTPDMSPKPNNPAIKAITRKIIDQDSNEVSIISIRKIVYYYYVVLIIQTNYKSSF